MSLALLKSLKPFGWHVMVSQSQVPQGPNALWQRANKNPLEKLMLERN